MSTYTNDTSLDLLIAGIEDQPVKNTNPQSPEKPDLVNLQMLMITSSMNHEYTRKALEKCKSYTKREELLNQMDQLKSLYFSAREKLYYFYREHVETVESELRVQKQNTFVETELH